MIDTKKVYLVTGGSRGIGRAICEKLAAPNTIVIINYLTNESMAKETQRLIEAQGGTGKLFKCDVSDYEAVKKMIQNLVKEYKKIDGLINNAGILLMRHFMFTTKEDWDSILSTNLNGAFHCVKCVLPDMMRRQQGKIVNISSVTTQKHIAGSVAYTVSKYAINGFTKALAKELTKYGIIVNGINCGFIDTDMIRECSGYKVDMEPIGNPYDIAEWVGFLIKGETKFMSGEIITVDGGMSL